MKRSIFNGLMTMLTLLLAIGTFTLVAPAAHGQQDVDPTWYDPSPTAKKKAPESAEVRPAKKKPSQKAGAGASKPVTRKTRHEGSAAERGRTPTGHFAQ